MVIAKMNSVLLKHSRIMFGLFTAIIIIPFVWFFTPGASGNILFGTNPMSPNAVVGSVFDREITRGELMEMIKDNMLVMAANYGVSPVMNGLDDQALEEAFQKAVLLSVAKQMGVTVSVERVGEYLRSLPAFAGTDGKFSLEKYQKYEKEMLQPLGYNALDLDRAVRNLLTIFSLGNSAVNEVIVTENEIADFERTVLERCTVKTILFPFAAARKELKPTEAELQNFHKANPKLFMTEPQYRVKVVRFNYADYADKVKLAPDAARKYYDANKAEFTKNGKTTPFASVEKTIKAKLQKNEMVKLAKKAGREFREALYDVTAELPESAHAEAFIAHAGKNAMPVVESGWFTAESSGMDNVGREPRLVEAVVALEDRSPITRTVEGERAVFVAVLSAKKPSVESDYKSVAAKVREVYLNNKSTALAQEKARTFALEMSKAADPAKSLAALAKGAVVKTLPPFTQMEPPKENAQAVMALTAGTENGKLSRSLDLPDGVFMVFVVSRTEPDAAALKKNRETLSANYRQGKQYAIYNSFQTWILMNTRNYMARQTQEP